MADPNFAGDNGPATSAQIDPVAVTVDTQGNLYIADGLNYRIRKVNTNGIITTIGGNGTEGDQGDTGPATSAEIDLVTDLAVDNAGNVYLADYFNFEVRKIDTAGMMTDFAGGVQYGSIADGVAATMAVMVPDGVAFDGSGNLYISDANSNNNVVRRVDLSTGLIYTLAGTGVIGFTGDGGQAVAAELSAPAGIAVSGGVVYFADLGNLRIRKVASNIITTVAGTGTHDNGPATSAFLNFPEGITIDGSGNILVADTANAEARRFKAGGNINSVGQLSGRNALWRDRGSGRQFLSYRRGAKLSERDTPPPQSDAGRHNVGDRRQRTGRVLWRCRPRDARCFKHATGDRGGRGGEYLRRRPRQSSGARDRHHREHQHHRGKWQSAILRR